MTAGILMKFNLHVRCESCVRESTLTIDVPNIEGAPTTADELMQSGLIDQQPFKCIGCDSEICHLLAIVPFQNEKAEEMRKRPKSTTGEVTLYIVKGYTRDKYGRFKAEQPIQMPSADAAKRRAQRYADAGAGALATSQTGDPALGDWGEVEIIAHCGPVPRSAFNEMDEAAA